MRVVYGSREADRYVLRARQVSDDVASIILARIDITGLGSIFGSINEHLPEEIDVLQPRQPAVKVWAFELADLCEAEFGSYGETAIASVMSQAP